MSMVFQFVVIAIFIAVIVYLIGFKYFFKATKVIGNRVKKIKDEMGKD